MGVSQTALSSSISNHHPWIFPCKVGNDSQLCCLLQALQRLTEAAEKAKMELSQLTQTSISLPFITATADGPKHIEQSISRAKFEDMCSDLLDRCRVPVERALKDANLNLNEMNEVILVGGSTRIPAVQVSHPFIAPQVRHKTSGTVMAHTKSFTSCAL